MQTEDEVGIGIDDVLLRQLREAVPVGIGGIGNVLETEEAVDLSDERGRSN